MKVTTSILQNSFGKYLNMAMEGELITIIKNNKPVAQLSGIPTANKHLIREEAIEYVNNHRVSYEEFLKLSNQDESNAKFELIDGKVYAMTSPLFPHQFAVTALISQFYNWFIDKPCKPIVASFDIKLSNGAATFEEDPNVVQPDIIVICDLENITKDGRYEGVPTLVVEVLSKSTKSKDLFIKSSLYMNSGVKEYWIVDTDLKQVTLYLFEDKQIKEHRVFSNGESVTSLVFEGFEISVRDVFV